MAEDSWSTLRGSLKAAVGAGTPHGWRGAGVGLLRDAHGSPHLVIGPFPQCLAHTREVVLCA